MIKFRKNQLTYTGSVKNLWTTKKPTSKKPGVIVFEFTDDFSIFDYGKMPDVIPGKGAAMAMGSAFIFESLQSPKAWKNLETSKAWNKIKQKKLRRNLLESTTFKSLKRGGLPTHYRGLIDPDTGKTVSFKKLKKHSNYLEVDAARIIHPEKVEFGGGIFWDYNKFTPSMRNFLVPLECIFRFGVPTGSSLFERIKLPGYLESLGLAKAPVPNQWLSRPVVEYFSKLEPSDRHLNHESALNFSGLSQGNFIRLHELTLLVALFLTDLFKKAQLNLWDGKFEFLMGEKDLSLGDAITPDELRLTYKGVQISKEPLRQYYKKYEPKFVKAMKEAKVRATKVDKSLRDIVNNDLKCPPPKMDKEFLDAVSYMYTGLVAKISGSGHFKNAQPMSKVLRTFKKFKIA